MSGSVLLVEDHQDIAEMVCAYLERRGYEMDYAADGITGLHLAVSNTYDVIILDLMLPGMTGLSLCEKLRGEAGKDTPVLMLTARDTLDDKVLGFATGADDYLVKPFEIKELEARLSAMVRRQRGAISREVLAVGDLSFDTGTLEVKRGEQILGVAPIGLKLLAVLMRASPGVVSTQMSASRTPRRAYALYPLPINTVRTTSDSKERPGSSSSEVRYVQLTPSSSIARRTGSNVDQYCFPSE